MDDQTQSIHEFKINLKGVIKILAQHLYPERDVFVREMLQNAYDSLTRRKVEEGGKSPAGNIHVHVDPVRRQISFIDNGPGLTQSEIHDYLATIGRSGTDEFRQKLIQMGRLAETDLIGQFGIGLLSTFIVADQVEVVTRTSIPGQPVWRWTSSGEKEYTLEIIDQPDEGIEGTTVTLTIGRGKHDDLLQVEAIRKAIRKYADFLPVPIYLDDEAIPTNIILPPWHQSYEGKDESEVDEDKRLREYKAFLIRRYSDNMLHIIPVKITARPRVYGALYISDRMILDDRAGAAVDIYHRGMFIQEGNRDLLPSWATFVLGVLDVPDLEVTLARDNLRKDAAFFAAQEAIGHLIVQDFKQLVQRDPAKLQGLLSRHADAIKRMALTKAVVFDEIADLVPFETNRGRIGLQKYFQYSQTTDESGNRCIFYFTDSKSATQYYLLSDEQELVVINASYPPDEKFLEKYAQKYSVKLQHIGALGFDSIFIPLSAEERKYFSNLENAFKRHLLDLRGKIQIVHFRPRDLPAVIVQSAEADPYRNREKAIETFRLPESVSRMLEGARDNISAPSVVLYLNADNPIIQRLQTLNLESDVAKCAILAIKNNSRLLSAPVLTKLDFETMNREFNQVIDLLIANTVKLEQARAQLTKAQLTTLDLRWENTVDKTEISSQRETVIAPSMDLRKGTHIMFTPEQQVAWQILQKAFTLVADELKQRWQLAREKTKSTEAPQNEQAQPKVSIPLQTTLKTRLESMRDTVQLEMITDDLETAITIAKKYNRLYNKYRKQLPVTGDLARVEIQMEDAEAKREEAITEIKAIFEKLAEEKVIVAGKSK